MNGEGKATREATLQAVRNDQVGLRDRLTDLEATLYKIEKHLMGTRIDERELQRLASNPYTPMSGEAAAGIQDQQLGGGLAQPAPEPGLLPQMCEDGVRLAVTVTDICKRIELLAHQLGVGDI